MDWEECNSKKLIKPAKIDESLIKSLIKSSSNKLESNNRLRLGGITASSKLGLVYDSLREILEALAIKNGFKIYNHECFCSFLKEICKEENFSAEFDEFRKLRNQINYYAKEISLDETKILIEEMTELRNAILRKFIL
jgi:hypothetical protein